MRLTAVIQQQTDLHPLEARDWIARGWVHAEPVRAEPMGAGDAAPEDFDVGDVDIARIRLIHELRHALAVEEETVPLVLDLLDQVYGLRRSMRAVARALADEPRAIRVALDELLRDFP